MIDKGLYFLLAVTAVVMLALSSNRCTNIIDTDGITDSSFTFDSDNYYRVDSTWIFNTDIGFSTDFHGIKTCTTVTNSNNITIHPPDSFYGRITCINDTSFTLNDSTYGQAYIHESDFASWNMLTLYLMDSIPPNMIGEILIDYMDSATLALFDTLEVGGLTHTHKKVIIHLFNNIIETPTLYHTYHERIYDLLIPMEKIYTSLTYLVDCSIMLDTSGALQPDALLSSYQRERLKWFNCILLTDYLDIKITGPLPYERIFNKALQAGRVFNMYFQQGSSPLQLNEKEILRLFDKSITSINQIGYKDKYGFSETPTSKISDFPLKTDISWTVSPFLWTEVPYVPDDRFTELLLPGSATSSLLRVKKLITGVVSIALYSIKCYYPLSGTFIENGNINRILGTIVINIEFYKRYNRPEAVLTRWDSDIAIERMSESGDKTRYIEKVSLETDSSGVI